MFWLKFQWDPNKAARNQAKHGVSFKEAATVFWDPWGISLEDEVHSESEIRFLMLGRSWAGPLLVVSHTYAGYPDLVRIISARRATKSERAIYERQ